MSDDNGAVFNEIFKDRMKTKQPEPDFDIVLVLDRSGSMGSIRQDVIGGLNTFIEEQKKEGGSAYFSMVQFDNNYGDPQTWRTPLMEVNPFTNNDFIPRGGTALLDAIGKTIARVREMRRDGEITGKVQFVIQTDGEENSSGEYTSVDMVSELINEVKEERWGDFIFLGANIDSFSTGGGLGIGAGTTANFANNARGVEGATYFASVATKSFRYGDALDADAMADMQTSVAEGKDVKSLYDRLDANIKRDGTPEDPTDI